MKYIPQLLNAAIDAGVMPARGLMRVVAVAVEGSE